MSIENQKTVEVYQKIANKYLDDTIKHEIQHSDDAKQKKEKLQKFMKKSFSILKKENKIFEIGSADGENAKFLAQLGYTVTASDIADDFINAIKSNGLNAINFNVLEDEFEETYNGIFCWRVFVHFTKRDVQKVIKKTYDALEKNGIFVFNAMNREGKEKENEWVDFQGEFHLGIDRYYNYYYQEELEEIIKKNNYQILSFHKEGGKDNNKWLVYVLKK